MNGISYSRVPELPVDLLLRPAYELPRNRRKRRAAWARWIERIGTLSLLGQLKGLNQPR